MKNRLDTSPWHQREKPISVSMLRLVVFAAVCLFGGALAGGYLVETLAYEAILERNQLISEKQQLSEKLEGLRLRQAILESGSKVDRLSVEKTEEELSALLAQLDEAKEELRFYQRVMVPEKGNKALYIQDFRLLGSHKEGHHQYMLTLSQGAEKKGVVTGKASLLLRGVLLGKEVELEFKQLNASKNSSLPFKFRYFQSLTGEVSLPSGFEPQSVKVVVKLRAKRSKQVEKVWSWQALLDASRQAGGSSLISGQIKQ